MARSRRSLAGSSCSPTPATLFISCPSSSRESAIFNNRAGEAGKPITLDGHGATLDGSEDLNPDDWPEIAPGLFRNDHLLRLDDAVIQRWFFLWDGKMNHMGRTSKGLRPDFKKPEDLQPGEWTFIKDDSRKQPNSAKYLQPRST